MIFTPYTDEAEKINLIHKYHNEDYAVIRLTATMIEKNNLDANGIFRELLLTEGFVDYEQLENGGANGVCTNALFIQDDKNYNVVLKFYRVNNSRGDRRFSIETIKKKCINQDLNVGDLIYFSVIKNDTDKRIIIINLTHNTPKKAKLEALLGVDKVEETLNELYPKMVSIAKIGYHNNSKGEGKIAPKDAGDTLESLLGIVTNNSQEADYKGIELKTKMGKTLDTLFTLRPNFQNTAIEKIEPVDRNRVAAFTRYYGYNSDKHPDSQSLYITIGSQEAPQNKQGFYLEVNEELKRVELWGISPEKKKSEVTAFWTFDELKKELHKKHPATLWIKAESRMCGTMAQFRYTEMEMSRAPQFTTFLSLIKTGGITYDWRGYTSISGSYTGKNHGNAWRIRSQYKSFLFGEIKPIKLI